MLTKKQLSHIEKRLLEERARALRSLGLFDEMAKADRESGDTDLSAYTDHMADQGTEAMEREKAALFATKEGRYLYRLEEALRRLYNDPENFGACHTCGHLVARSSNGKIEMEGHRGSIDASTSNGLIHCTLEQLGAQGVQLATSNGRIVLDLPEAVDAEVDIRVDNGVIRNDRELCKAMRERSGELRGRLGKGGATIRLRTSNGSVSLR